MITIVLIIAGVLAIVASQGFDSATRALWIVVGILLIIFSFGKVFIDFSSDESKMNQRILEKPTHVGGMPLEQFYKK